MHGCVTDFEKDLLEYLGRDVRNLAMDNPDVFTKTDNNYTNGVGIAWVSGAVDVEDAAFVGRWLWSFLPFVATMATRPTPRGSPASQCSHVILRVLGRRR